MKFSEAFKVFQLNILRQSGIMVTPQQVGLKSDPIADLQAQNGTLGTSFASTLNGLSLGMKLPVIPTLPEDTANSAAMKTYHEQMLAYSQNMQLYNQRFMQLMLNQMQQMQTAVSRSQNSASSSSSVGSVSDTGLGIGGIL